MCESEERKQWRVNPLSPLTLISPWAEPGSSGPTAAVSRDEWQPAGGGWGRWTLCYVRSTVVCLSEEVTFRVGWMDRGEERE